MTIPGWRPALRWSGAAAGGVACAALLSDGAAGGDEGDVLSYLFYYVNGGWRAVMSRYPDNAYLAHRLIWLTEKIVWNAIVDLLLPASLAAAPVAKTFALVLDGPLFMVAGFLLAVHHLVRRNFSWPVAILAPSCLLLASSGISLFTGGLIECAMCLLVIVIGALLDRTEPLSRARLCALIMCSALLIFAKLYAGFFVLLLAPILPGTRHQRITFAAAIVAAPLLWLALQSGIRGNDHGGMIPFYTQLVVVLSPQYLLKEGFESFFSLCFGLIPCFPLLWVALLAPAAARRTLLFKSLALLSIIVAVLPFGYWFGPGGTGGPRYTVPFLLVFFPEVAEGLSHLAQRPRTRRLIFIVPLLATFFLPVLDYRNTLIGRYSGRSIDVAQIAWPHDDPAMHPAIFGWRVMAAKAQNQRTFQPTETLPIAFPTASIFPMTGISRMIYLLGRPQARSTDSQAVSALLRVEWLRDAGIWKAFRLLLIAAWLSILTWAAWAAGERKS